jgi:multidrug efflux pump subunit AcrA (membrane-fusion protein)
MKIIKLLLSTLVLGSLIITAFGCGSPTETDTADGQIATVIRGDLTLDITAAGNLALSQIEDLAIELFYPTGTKGTIASILVEEGDSVEEGQVLVTLDRDEWDKQLKIIKQSFDTAQRNVITKEGLVTDAERQVATLQRQVTVKENDLMKAKRLITSKELAVRQAELNVQTANNTLFQIADVKKVQDRLEDAERTLEIIAQIISGQIGGGLEVSDINYWITMRTMTKQELADAQEDLQDVLSEHNLSLTTDVKLQIAQKKFQVDQYLFAVEDAIIALEDAKFAVGDAELAVDNAKYAVENALQSLENAKLDLDSAQTNLEDAQKDYDDAMSMSPEIMAPFDGFVTQVNVSGGDEVLNGTVAVQIADPDKFEADILVSEMDITQVKLDSVATVTADAIMGVAFPAKVTHIAPTATIQSGVVNYTVKVEVEAASTANQTPTGVASGNATVELPRMLQMAVDSGRMTQEQAEELVKNGPQGDFTPSEDFTPPEGFSPPEGFTPPEDFEFPEGFEFPMMPGSQAMRQVPDGTTGDFQLRQGLTVTVSIIMDSRTSVLLVPNGAVTTEGLQSFVEVVSASGDTEKRVVSTGLSDWQYTEITDGLEEGEQVKVNLNTSLSSTSQMQGGMFFGPPR